MSDLYIASDKRYEKMKYNHVGKSGLKFPAVSLGFRHNFGSNGNYGTMALAWIEKDSDVCSVIIGASRPEQIEDNVRFLNNTSFTEEELKKIDDICGVERR